MSDNAHSWRFYLSPAAAWDAMYAECEGAAKQILMEQYILENDDVGQKFLRLFIQKAKQGLKVQVVCDKVGSYSLTNSPLIDELRQAGGSFRFYNPFTFIQWLRVRRWMPRTHAKTLVVDSAAFMGGVCLAERMKDWRDTQIRVTGPVVAAIQHALEQNAKSRWPFRKQVQSTNDGFTYLQSEPWHLRHKIYKAMVRAIRGAEQSIYISMGFFVPTRRVRRLLMKAAARGVKVIVLVPQHSDFWLADWVFLSYAGRLLKAGVRIFHYQPTVLHNKTMVVDRAWATVGSSNMDALSFFRNRESNLVITDKDVLDEMEKDFLNDLNRSEELTFALLKQIPLWKRIAAHLGRVFRSFL